jgi:hypothetical protein
VIGGKVTASKQKETKFESWVYGFRVDVLILIPYLSFDNLVVITRKFDCIEILVLVDFKN